MNFAVPKINGAVGIVLSHIVAIIMGPGKIDGLLIAVKDLQKSVEHLGADVQDIKGYVKGYVEGHGQIDRR